MSQVTDLFAVREDISRDEAEAFADVALATAASLLDKAIGSRRSAPVMAARR